MSKEISLYQALTAVGQAFNTFMQSRITRSDSRKQDEIILQEKLEYLKTACRIKGIGEVTRQAISEFERTLYMIMKNNFSVDILNKLMEMGNKQYEYTLNVIQRYASD